MSALNARFRQGWMVGAPVLFGTEPHPIDVDPFAGVREFDAVERLVLAPMRGLSGQPRHPAPLQRALQPGDDQAGAA